MDNVRCVQIRFGQGVTDSDPDPSTLHPSHQAEALAIAYVIVGVLLPSLTLPTIGFRLLAKVGCRREGDGCLLDS